MSISKIYIKNYKCFKDNIIELFQTIISPMFKSVHLLFLRNDIFQKTRDLLLPCLISGEIDIEELDIEVREDA